MLSTGSALAAMYPAAAIGAAASAYKLSPGRFPTASGSELRIQTVSALSTDLAYKTAGLRAFPRKRQTLGAAPATFRAADLFHVEPQLRCDDPSCVRSISTPRGAKGREVPMQGGDDQLH
jgi:hypothetical protein